MPGQCSKEKYCFQEVTLISCFSFQHYFAHNLGRRGNPPLLAGDLCLVLWRSAGSSPIIGQSVVRVRDTEEGAEVTVPEYPVGVRMEMEGGGLAEHDFVQASSCSVRGRVVLESRDKAVMLQYGLREQVRGTRIMGNTGEIRLYLNIKQHSSYYLDGFVWLDKNSVSELQFSVLVTRPGFYHLNNFQFRAKQMASVTFSKLRGLHQSLFFRISVIRSVLIKLQRSSLKWT